MRRVNVLFMGEYPGTSAGAKRVCLYEKGLLEAGCQCAVMATGAEPPQRLRRIGTFLTNPLADLFFCLRRIPMRSCLLVYGGRWPRLLAVVVAARLKGVKIILEINEKPYSPYGTRLSEIRVVKTANRFIFERLVIPLADGFIVISKSLENYIFSLTASRANVLRIPILVDNSTPIFAEPTMAAQEPFVLHAGAFSEQKDGVLGMLRAISVVNRRCNIPLHAYFTERIAPKSVICDMKRILEEQGLEDMIHFIGRIPEEQLRWYQERSAMLILFKPDNEQNRYNFSTKLGEYLSLGKPVIFTPVGEVADYLKDGLTGYRVAPDDLSALSNAISDILKNPGRAKEIGANGKRLAEKEFDYKVHGRRLTRFCEDL